MAKRYTALLALAAVQIVLVALAPSNGGSGSSASLGGSNFGTASNGTSAGPAGTATGGPGGTASGSALGAGGGSGVAGSRTGAAAGSSTVTKGGAATGAATGAAGGGGAAPVPALVTDAGCVNGRQAGPTYYMPPCTPTYRPDPQATMPGVTPTVIHFVYYVAQANAEVNAILSAENLAASTQNICEAAQAFTAELNKRYELYGRTFVSMDGPGANSGSAAGGSCHFPFFQGNCSLTPPDIPCFQAEADTIAKMGPAFEIGGTYPQFFFRLAQDHVLTAGGSSGAENIPEAYYDQLAPYYYNVFPSGSQTVQQLGEFYCKKLVGQPVQFAGRGAGDVIPVTGSPPTRKLGIIFPSNNGDVIVKTVADQLEQIVSGCGAQGTQEYSYASDITTAQSQSTTTVAAIKQAGITTLVCLCDPIAPVFLTNTLDQQGYHPELLIPGSGLLDYDVLGQLYNKNEMRYAFGPSELADAIPFADSDAVKAWQDAGNAGQPDQTENLYWAYFSLLGTAFQMAGPDPTVANIRAGLSSYAGYGGTPTQPLFNFLNPFPWTQIKDFREVYFCPTATSPINGQPGAYQPAFGGHRFQLGQLAAGDSEIFPNGVCA
ncbi:MAG TPA: hypothetical protein VND70_08870 [Acidimicrobiales bacterium]|nr:hypothetical protein [Acidimicrobiales bacterium]